MVMFGPATLMQSGSAFAQKEDTLADEKAKGVAVAYDVLLTERDRNAYLSTMKYENTNEIDDANEEIIARAIYMQQFKALGCGFPWIHCAIDAIEKALRDAYNKMKDMVVGMKKNAAQCGNDRIREVESIMQCTGKGRINNGNLQACLTAICIQRNNFPEVAKVCSTPTGQLTVALAEAVYGSWAIPVANLMYNRCAK